MGIINKTSIGLDISDRSIEAVKIGKTGKKIKIIAQGRAELEPGVVEYGEIKDEAKLEKAIKDVFAKSSPHPIVDNKIVFGLPESQLFTKIISVPNEKELNEKEVIREEIISTIPIIEEDLFYYYKEIKDLNQLADKNNKTKNFLVIAVDKKIIKSWQNFFKKIKIDIQYFDIESLANYRGLFAKNPAKPICILDIGKNTTSVFVFSKTGLIHSYAINRAGNYFTKQLSEGLKIDQNKAEKLKISEGLKDAKKKNSKILSTAIDLIIDEVKKTLEFFKKNSGLEVAEIKVIGGSAKLIGLEKYFKSKFEVPLNVGKSDLLGGLEKIEYIEAVGLALRELESEFDKHDLKIPLVKEKNYVIKKMLPYKKFFKHKNNAVTDADNYDDGGGGVKKQLIILLIILVLGAVMIGAALVNRRNEKLKKLKSREEQLNQLTVNQMLALKIIIAVDANEYTSERVRGRIIEADAVVTIEDIKKELKKEEDLWLEPINNIVVQFATSTPTNNKWLVYAKEDADKIFIQEINKINRENIKYILNNITKTNIEKTDNPALLYLMGEVNISAEKEIVTL